jgi:hypothetical protein
MVAACARLRELQGDQREMVHVIAGNGSGYAVNDARADEFASAVADMESCVEELAALGVRVKDADTGLVDFPALRHGEEVLLCWQVGEDAVRWWHGGAEGFASRSPIDWDDD